jgi:hypothetical protein
MYGLCNRVDASKNCKIKFLTILQYSFPNNMFDIIVERV